MSGWLRLSPGFCREHYFGRISTQEAQNLSPTQHTCLFVIQGAKQCFVGCDIDSGGVYEEDFRSPL